MCTQVTNSRHRANSWSPDKQKLVNLPQHCQRQSSCGQQNDNDDERSFFTKQLHSYPVRETDGKHNKYADGDCQSIDSPISKSLLNSYLQVCESKVKMDQFLKRSVSQTQFQDDNDDMSTELRMLKLSEEKLRSDLENVDTSMFLPHLCYSSDVESQGSLSHESIFGNASQANQTVNFPQETLDRFTTTTNETNLFDHSPNYKYKDKFGRHSACKCNDTLTTITATTGFSSLPTNTSESYIMNEYGYNYDISIEKVDDDEEIPTYQDQDLFELFSSYLFGLHKYKVKSFWNLEGPPLEYTRSIQGTMCIFVSTFIALCGIQSQASMCLYEVFYCLVASSIITFSSVKMPHTISDVHLGASIFCVNMLLHNM